MGNPRLVWLGHWPKCVFEVGKFAIVAGRVPADPEREQSHEPCECVQEQHAYDILADQGIDERAKGYRMSDFFTRHFYAGQRIEAQAGAAGDALEAQGLRQGAMISANKTCPEGHECFFNACIFIKERTPLTWRSVFAPVKYRQVWHLSRQLMNWAVTYG